ncbi:hypothetical protein [Mycolicibacterium farcinogenes]|uniref:Uncharacterized protein n=1 Tax=Mycolicibacterium farcinogenes TaxID=1802 RepID=A0ACD1FD66_MYCFR|nr:hypothetical protein [Mycolicibacterium farcinogenes]QZH65008.1 hypothetical protein K6L26_23855 [Mycolicibacterium farcinogenes]
MLPVNKIQQNPYARAIQTVLDEPLGQFKPSTFTVLYTIGQLVQKNPGKAITMLQISTTSGVGERTTQTAVKGQLTVTFTELGEISKRWSW